jgi:N-acyl-D-amino-acid deacylase
MNELLIKGGAVHDGSGAEPYSADVLIADGLIRRIAEEGIPDAGLPPGRVVDARGLAVAPGFLDIQSHSDWIVPESGHPEILRPLMLQGVTTFMGGNCGFSPFPVDEDSRDVVLENSRFLTNDAFAMRWRSQRGYFDYVERRGSCFNMANLAGHGAMRAAIRGNEPGPLSAAERGRLAAMLEQAFAEGAYGVSLGLSYVPGIFSDDAELEQVFRAAARAGRIVTIHGRTYSRTSPFYPDLPADRPHNLADMEYSIAMAEKTGAKLHISHLLLKGSETWDLWPRALELFDAARARGVDVSFGVIPYHWGNTLILTLFPRWFLEDFSGNIARPGQVRKLAREVGDTERAIGRKFSDLHLLWGVTPQLRRFEGMSFAAIAKELGVDEIAACLHIAKESGGKAKVLTAAYSGEEGVRPEPLERLLEHPLSLVEIDTILTSAEGPQNPASFGACPKWLGHYSRERRLMPLERAVRRLTGAPADRFGLSGRGYVREGFAADLVVFDPAAVRDRNTIQSPTTPPVGIERVLINGIPQPMAGPFPTAPLAGRVLRCGKT